MQNLEMEAMELNEEELLAVDGGNWFGKVMDVVGIAAAVASLPATDGASAFLAGATIGNGLQDLS